MGKKQLIFEGLKVLELASVLAGPSVGMFLAELGAEVIKVEHFLAGGDVTRRWKLPSESPESDISAYFSSVNWGKKSIGIDLSKPAGRALIHRLAAQSDIVLASFKPGDAEKLQMDAHSLRENHPELIYAEINAYGRENPRTGYDAIIQAEAGFTFMNGTPDSGPVKMPVALMDVLAGHHLKEAVLLALLRRERTGEGGYLSTSLLQAGVASLVNQAANWLVAGHIPQRMGSDHPNIVPYGTIFKTHDEKFLVLAVGSDGQFEKLCRVLDHPEWAADARFATNPDRVRHREETVAVLQEAIHQWDRNTLLQALEVEKVPAGAVKNLEEVMADPLAIEMILKHPGIEGVSGVAIAGWEKVPHEQLSPPPRLCADTETVLKSHLKLSEAEITQLVQDQIIGIHHGEG